MVLGYHLIPKLDDAVMILQDGSAPIMKWETLWSPFL